MDEIVNRFIRNRQELEHLIISMHAEGWKKRALARRFGVSRNTVKRILKQNEDQRDHGHDVLLEKKPTPRKSKLDDWLDVMKDLLDRYPNITGVRMYEHLADRGFNGGKTIVTDRLRQMRPRPKKAPVVRFETDPGVQGQMDWSEYKIAFVGSGKEKVLCFSYILGFSRKQYIDFTWNRKFFTLIRRHQDAFEWLGGVPKTALYDNEKTVVLRWEGGQPLYNPAFISFITHYRCRPIACRPGSAKTKGKVERPFDYVEKNLLNARDFQDMDDLRQTGRWWLINRAEVRIHETTGRAPQQLFLEQEQQALLPLPAHPYDACETALRVCRTDGFIEHETNLYSVPFEHVADIVTLKATEHEVFIYSPHMKQIACHERKPSGAGVVVEEPAHRKSAKVRYGLEPVKESFLQLGECAAEFLEGLKQRHPRNCGFQARYILRLKERYHADDIHAALSRAIKYYAFDGKSIERILKAIASPRTLESVQKEQAAKLLSDLPKIRQRPLSDYRQLLSF